MQRLNKYLQNTPSQGDMVDYTEYSTTGQYGLKKCFEGSNPIVDIVLVHGLTGNRETTWTDKSTGIFWAEHLLKNDVPEARVLTYGYDADVAHFWASASQNRVGNHSQNLANALSQLRERSETNDRAIIFVAHSLGGLVVEDTLLTSKNSAEPHIRQLLECTAGIAFLGTPHCGSDLGTWAKVFGHFTDVFKKTNTDLLGTLRPQSEVLARIQQEFHTMLRARRDDGKQVLSICCFYEELPVKGVGPIVPMHSAILPAYNSIGIRNTHMDMTKYPSEQDPGYLAVSNELWRWVKGVKTRKRAEEVFRSTASSSYVDPRQQPRSEDRSITPQSSQQIYSQPQYRPEAAQHQPQSPYNQPHSYGQNNAPYGLTQNNYYQNNNYAPGYGKYSQESFQRLPSPPQQQSPFTYIGNYESAVGYNREAAGSNYQLPPPPPIENRVTQEGHHIGNQNVSGGGKVVQGNNIRSEKDVTFNF